MSPLAKDDSYGKLEFCIDRDQEWGLISNNNFFPAHLYQTPLYKMLQIYPEIGLAFIVEFLNYSINTYVKSNCDKKQPTNPFENIPLLSSNGNEKLLENIPLLLDDDKERIIWGNTSLWRAYRVSSVTHHLLESLLIALEKFLLDIAEKQTEESKILLHKYFDYIYNNTNNVAPIAVLSSITMAYPNEVKSKMLPLLSSSFFILWDIRRHTSEHQAQLNWAWRKPQFIQDTIRKSNELPHRKKMLKLFFLDIQFLDKDKNFVQMIYNTLDRGKKTNNLENDIYHIYKQIDLREFEQAYDNETQILQLKLKNQDTTQERDSLFSVTEIINSHITINAKLRKMYNNEEKINFQEWEDYYNKYRLEQYSLFDLPIHLAIIGYRDFEKLLNSKQQQWCLSIIYIELLKISNTSTYSQEDKVGLTSFHLLLEYFPSKMKNIVLALFILVLKNIRLENNEKILTKYLGTTFYKYYPVEAKIILKGYILFMRSDGKEPKDLYHRAKRKDIVQKSKDFIKEICQNIVIFPDSYNSKNYPSHKEINSIIYIMKKNQKQSLSHIDIENCDTLVLEKTLLATPYNIDDKELIDFILHSINYLIKYLFLEDKEYSNSYNTISNLESYIADLFVQGNLNMAKQLLQKLLIDAYSDHFTKNKCNKFKEFIAKILDRTIYNTDQIITPLSDEDSKRYVDQFWELWKLLFEIEQKQENPYFIQSLLLDILWKEEAIHWKALEGYENFYQELVLTMGKHNIASVIKVLSTVGRQSFLPKGITWLSMINKEDEYFKKYNLVNIARPLIEYLFTQKESVIKDKELLDSYYFLLDKMIEQGSDLAYTFKTNLV